MPSIVLPGASSSSVTAAEAATARMAGERIDHARSETDAFGVQRAERGGDVDLAVERLRVGDPDDIEAVASAVLTHSTNSDGALGRKVIPKRTVTRVPPDEDSARGTEEDTPDRSWVSSHAQSGSQAERRRGTDRWVSATAGRGQPMSKTAADTVLE